MNAKRKTKATKRPAYTPGDGSPRDIDRWRLRKEKAQAVLATDFEEIRIQIDRLDHLIVSVLTDLSGNPHLSDTSHEMAKIAACTFIIRGALPAKAVTP